MRLSVGVCLLVGLCMFGSVPLHAQSAMPDPRVFKIPAKQLPWHTDFLLDARVESNQQATRDADLIYDPTIGASPTWTQLHRVTGWYEVALMKNGKMSPVVEILVSEFRSTADAHRAYGAEVKGLSFFTLGGHPHLGNESTEYKDSSILNDKGKKSRVESSTIYTRYRTVEFDVTVFDSHAPKPVWLQNYRHAAMAVASRLNGIAHRVVGTPKPSPTPTTKPTKTPTPTVIPPPPTPSPTATVYIPPPTAPILSTATTTPIPTATVTPVINPTYAAPQNVQVTAWVSNPNPPRYSSETVYERITMGGAGVAGVPMDTSWHYKTTTSSCSGVSDGSGTASCSGASAAPQRATRSLSI